MILVDPVNVNSDANRVDGGLGGDEPPTFPLAVELRSAVSPREALRRCHHLPNCLLLDSAMNHATLGRFSFLAFDPFETIVKRFGDPDALDDVRRRLESYPATPRIDLPPFQGGAAGMLSYELGYDFESIPTHRFREFDLPTLFLGFYDTIVAWDHELGQAWIVAQGFPETEADRRRQRAEQRIREFQQHLAQPPRPMKWSSPRERIDIARLAPQSSTGMDESLTSDFSRESYLDTVQAGIDYIYAGDIFQVNLSQRLLFPESDHPAALYLRLSERNPSTFAGYLDLGDFQVISASPERLAAVRQGEVETRPIKGTRQRTPFPEANLFAGEELKGNEKDRAENVMIVDLLRNDLSRVCDPKSVNVTQLCELEIYQFVQHLVSAIRGRLSAGKTAVDLIEALFPGGSITGAPKVRAMEIIAELEPTARGAYCGSLGYLGFDGAMDLSILIRTITAGRGWWQIPVGGGIVAQSNPESEYAETWHKAKGMLEALR